MADIEIGGPPGLLPGALQFSCHMQLTLAL
jgi:hypothetical protein